MQNDTNYLPENDIELIPSSGQDDTGRVFRWKGNIYRAIKKSHSHFYRDIFNSSLALELRNIGLIPTQITNYRVEGFDLVLKHETIPFVSYPIEWSSSMLRESALLTCNLQQRLINEKLILKDGHPFNIIFHGAKPYFTDIGSIEKFTSQRFKYFLNEFIADFILPLLLIRGDYLDLIDAIMLKYLGLPKKLSSKKLIFFRLLAGSLPLQEWISNILQLRRISKTPIHRPLDIIALLKSQIINIDLNASTDISENISWHPQHTKGYGAAKKTILELISKLSPNSIIIFSNNDIDFSESVAKLSSHTIDASSSDKYLNQLFLRNKNNSPHFTQPVRLDIFNPTPSHGTWSLCSAAVNRLGSDLAVFLDLTPSLLRDRQRSIEEFLKYISFFGINWIMLEVDFSNNTRRPSDLRSANFTLEHLKKKFSAQFKEISITTIPHSQRSIFLGSKLN